MSNARGPAGPVVLLVLDGWGYREAREGNAIELASTPVWHRLWDRSPRTLLEASGLAVGLPEGQMGNSEVGHLNLGAGRVVPQDLVRISQSIKSGQFYQLEPLTHLCAVLKHNGGTLHLLGLLGPGGVHAIDQHLVACLELGMRLGVPRIAVHGFLDGRDTLPTIGAQAGLDRGLGLEGPRGRHRGHAPKSVRARARSARSSTSVHAHPCVETHAIARPSPTRSLYTSS